MELRDAANLPSAKQPADETRLLAVERKRVEVVDGYDMAGVEFGRAPQHTYIVRVGNDVALVGAVIHALRERICHAEEESTREPAIPSNLERIVYGIGDVIRFPNGAKTLIRPEGVDATRRLRYKARVCRSNGCSRLVDVGLPLQVHTATGHISNAQERMPEHLALEGEVPGPGFGVLEGLALRRHH